MSYLSHTKRDILSGYNVATTGYIYNSNASSGSNDGWLNARYDEVTVQLGCATLTNKTVNFRVEGRILGGRNASLYVTSISVANSIDKMVRIPEKFDRIRVGARINTMVSTPLASPHNVYIRVGFTELK